MGCFVSRISRNMYGRTRIIITCDKSSYATAKEQETEGQNKWPGLSIETILFIYLFI